MENNKEGRVEFEQCIDFLTKMIELYGAEVLKEIEAMENSDEEHILHRKGIIT